MALLTFLAAETSSTSSTEAMKKKKQPPNSKRPKRPKQPKKQTSSWDQIKNLLTCKQIEGSAVRDPSSSSKSCCRRCGCGGGGGYSKLIMGSYSCSSICNFGDVAHSNTRVVHRADIISSPETTIKLHSPLKHHHLTSSNNLPSPLSPSTSRRSPLLAASLRSNGSITTSSAAIRTASLRGMPVPLRKLSGCYECHMIVDPARCPKPLRERGTVCVCSGCGEVFPKAESLELHRAIKHAVLELGPEDSGRNIVEIIFKSSWLKSDGSFCKIERILKVQNTPRTIQRFEHCRSAVKAHASTGARKNPRCAADGNELLRFHCTTLTCALGAHGASSLCCCWEPAGAGSGGCAVCAIIRHGFEGRTGGVLTTASSGRAHDRLDGGGRRAMLVCRVIAGRVKRVADGSSPGKVGDYVAAGGAYDSVAGHAGVYADLEDLVVLNPRAILPCFVVVYKALHP